MKKIFSLIYHFLGSIQFAILLIALTALFVIAGTFLEAHSGSHLFSASLTYQHPLFLALIWGFFLNILISALRRWPFQFKHIPFLTTHVGLLMLLAGVIIKSYFGIQGSLGLIEGGSTQRIFLPHTYTLHIEKKDPQSSYKKIHRDFSIDQLVKQKIKWDEIELRLVDASPHSHERKQTWIKDHHVIISGLKPIPVANFDKEAVRKEMIPVHFNHSRSTPWNVLAFFTNQMGDVSKEIYLNGLNVKISNSKTGEILSEMPLNDALKNPLVINEHRLNFILAWEFSLEGLVNPTLSAEINGDEMEIALAGPDSLINRNKTSPHLGKLPLTIDLIRDPVLLFLQDEQKNDYLFFFNPHGEIHSTLFNHDNLQSVMVYDGGFGGYAMHANFPFPDFPSSRYDKEQAELLRLAVQLRQNAHHDLASPLQLLKNAANATHKDFVESILLFLQAWDASSQLLLHSGYSDKLHPVIQHLDWDHLSLQEQYACGWLCFLLEEIQTGMQEGKNFSETLAERGWPLSHQFENKDSASTDQMIALFAQQLFAAAGQLPRPNVMPGMISAKALSAYLRAFGIILHNIREPIESQHLLRTYHAARLYNDRVRKILSPLDQQPTLALARLINSMPEGSCLLEDIRQAYGDFQKHQEKTAINSTPSGYEMSKAFELYAPVDGQLLSSSEADSLSTSLSIQPVILETPLTLNQEKMPNLKKWEDSHPLIALEIKKGHHKEYFTLTYDKYGTGLAWPILKGEYLIRYQPQFIEIPYKIRLHDARQINYPGTNQPYSYESDITIKDLKDQSVVEKTISMNHVYETKDGYRFYLAGLSPGEEIEPQHVQIIVNRDPAKYFLTYPGAIIMTLGIVLLFWMKPYRRL